MQKPSHHVLGIVGGLGAQAGADLYGKLIRAREQQADAIDMHVILEQHPYRGAGQLLSAQTNTTARKLYIFQTGSDMVNRGVQRLLIPCFASHVFREELQEEITIPVVDMMQALRQFTLAKYARGSRLGILTSDYVRHAKLFEKYFADQYEIYYPDETHQQQLMDAIYARHGIQQDPASTLALEDIHAVCQALTDQAVIGILPGFTELGLVAKAPQLSAFALPDINEIYARYALAMDTSKRTGAFKLGIVGGVGPAATVDFMNKVIRNTPAGRDQEHIKMVVEQNPQIPDRTANLVAGGTDPTVALLSTCKKLEAAAANAIVIPCNTAHAFVERIQSYLGIPIINMLVTTIECIRQNFPDNAGIGLMATNGTVQSGIYSEVARSAGLNLLLPDVNHQAKVMEAIYGDKGIKAGFTDGLCRQHLIDTLEFLAQSGAQAVILGCTELPLALTENTYVTKSGLQLTLLDPSELLAKRCVALAMAYAAPAESVSIE